MERMLEFADGSPESLRELASLFLSQTSGQLEQLEAGLQAGSAEEVRRLAHSCAGASATCGARRFVSLLRDLEARALQGSLEKGPSLFAEICREFDRVRRFLDAYIAERSRQPHQPSG
jgi:HPt (histidine-containing phosphotransfer) domain-containing protein